MTVPITIKQEGHYIIISDIRDMSIINNTPELAALNIPDETKRILFTAPKDAFELDYKEIKSGFLIFRNSKNNDKFVVEYTDSAGNDNCQTIIENWFEQGKVSIKDIYWYCVKKQYL